MKFKSNRVLSCILALAMFIGCFTVFPKSTLEVKADSADFGGGNISQGSIGGASAEFNSNNTAGYRIYLAPNALEDVGENSIHFTVDYYNKLNAFKDIALYEFYTWGDSEGYLGRTIYTYKGADRASKCLALGKSPDNNCDFAELGFSGGASRVNYSQPLDGANSYSSFTELANKLRDTDIVEFKDRFLSCLTGRTDLSQEQQNELNLLNSIDADELMVVAEPVFVSGHESDGSAYAIGNEDWTVLKQFGGAVSLSNRCDKLSHFYTKFNYKGNEVNVSEQSGGINGFGCYYWKYNMQGGKDETKIGASYNITLGYGGNLSANTKTTGVDGSVSLTETSKASSNESNDVGADTYRNNMTSYNSLVNSGVTSETLASKSYAMTGETFNQSVWDSQVQNEFKGKLADLKPALVGQTDANNSGNSKDILRLIGNMSYPQIDSIASKDLYLQGYSTVKIPLNSGQSTSMNALYGVANAGVVSEVKGALGSIQAVTNSQTANKSSINIGKTYSLSYEFSNGQSANQALSEKIRGGLGNSGVQTQNLQGAGTVNSDYTNGKAISQDNAGDTQELLSRVQGSSAMDGVINAGVDFNSPISFDVNDNSSVNVTLSTLTKKQYVNSYVASARLGQADSVEDEGIIGYKFVDTGASSSDNHLVQSTNDYTINASNFKTVAETTRKGNTFAVVWKNTDATSKPAYDLSYNDRDNKAQGIAEGVASYLNNGTGVNTDHYVTSKDANLVKEAFENATGIKAVQVANLGIGNSFENTISLGSVDDGSNITGLSMLVLTVDGYDVPIVSDTTLDSDMLNVVAPCLLGADSKKTSLMSVNPANFGGYNITQNLGGDMLDRYGLDCLYYNDNYVERDAFTGSMNKGIFDEPTVSVKGFDNGTVATPSYAFNVSRALWGDNVTVCNFRGITGNNVENSEFYKDFVKSSLKLDVDSIPADNSFTLGENVDGSSDIIKRDEYKFNVEQNGSILYDKFLFGGRIYNTDARYKLRNKVNKYTPFNTDTAKLREELSNKANSGTSDITQEQGLNYRCALTDFSNKDMTIYPEVGMKMYIPQRGSNFTVFNATDLYVLGEKARRLKPTSLRTIKVSTQSKDPINGALQSDTMATGKDSSKLSGDKANLPVVYAGGDVNLKVTNDISIDLASYSLDLTDNACGINIKDIFKFNDYNAKVDHESYVKDTASKLSINMQLDAIDDTDKLINEFSNFKVSVEDPTVGETQEQSFAVQFKNGVITEESKTSIVSDIAATYGVSEEDARKAFDNAGFEEQFKSALESNSDENNMSKNKWYDEQVTTCAIKKYTTKVNLGTLALADKIDITSGTNQDAKDSQLFRTGCVAKWYMTVALKEGIKTANDSNFSMDSYKTLWNKQYVSGSDFVVSDATTSDMRK